MEKLRADKFNASATLLQKNVRRFIYRSRYVHMKELALRLQCVARQKTAASKLQTLREQKAAIQIQTQWRRFSARKAYIQKQQFIVHLQSAIRTYQARQKLVLARKSHAATQIQRLVRGWYVFFLVYWIHIDIRVLCLLNLPPLPHHHFIKTIIGLLASNTMPSAILLFIYKHVSVVVPVANN